jgi:hypothetical protein
MNGHLPVALERGRVPSTEAIILGLTIAFIIPALVFLTASMTLFKQAENRPLPVFLARTSMLILLIRALMAARFLRAPPNVSGSALPLTLILVLLHAWMTIDFLRSALRTRFPLRATDLAVLVSLLSALALLVLVLANAGGPFT